MFNLTKNITLEPKWQKYYRLSQAGLFLVFVLGCFYLAYLILFPSKNLIYAFANDQKQSSFIANLTAKNGELKANDIFSFDSFVDENHSAIEILATLDSGSLENSSAKLQKTYQAFTYPLSDTPAVFPGTSPNRYLLSYNNAVYIVVGGKIMPFADPFTFDSFGFSWDDVKPDSEDEIGQYERGVFFNVNQPHPDGTIFRETGTDKYYLVENGQRKIIQQADIPKFLTLRTPIEIKPENSTFFENCVFKKASLFGKTYYCQVSNENFNLLPGNDYKISITPQAPVKINTLEIVFSENVNSRSLILSLSKIRNRFYNHYGIIPQQ